MKLINKKLIKYNGPVYDLKVSTDDTSYIINNIVVHNSAGGSLVLWLLDITKIDPIKHNLIFERFLNPIRTDPPDVDCDISSGIHHRVEEYLKEKYGTDTVCHIANFTKFGAKTVIKDLCRIFELDFKLSNDLTALFSGTIAKTVEEEIDKAIITIKKMNNKQLLEFAEKHREMFITYGNKLIGVVRQYGRHASGILISNKKLVESNVPIIRIGDEIISGITEGGDEREIGELGYLKLDILGLITAEVTNETFKKIKEHYNITNIEYKIMQGNFDDKKVYEEFCKGNVRDIFQFGSDSMIEIIKRTQPHCLDDLTTINGLFRPAIIAAKGIDEYINNRNNMEIAKAECDKIHEDLWPTVKDTCGVICLEGKSKILTENGEIEIQDIVNNNLIGTKLPTFNENLNIIEDDEITNCINSGEKIVYEIVLDSGEKIQCTEDHKLYTNNGWKMLKNLTIDDKIYTIN